MYKDAWGVVHLRGVITGGTTGVGFNGRVVNLPCGFGPASEERFLVASANGTPGEVRVTPTYYEPIPQNYPLCSGLGFPGSVIVVRGSTEWLSLSGISWRAAPGQSVNG
jgi:hypothetical protein